MFRLLGNTNGENTLGSAIGIKGSIKAKRRTRSRRNVALKVFRFHKTIVHAHFRWHRLVEVAERKQRERIRGREIERQLQINEREILPTAATERGIYILALLYAAPLSRVHYHAHPLAPLKLFDGLDNP